MSPPDGGIFLCALFYFLVVAVQGPSTSGSPCVRPGNIWQAEHCCDKKGARLPDTPTDPKASHLRNTLQEKRINSTWINVRLEMMSSWEWIDGTKPEFNHLVPLEHGCAWFNQKTKRVETGHCTDRTVGSICSFKDSHCSRDILSHIGVGHNGICYAHYCEQQTWHKSRAGCRKWNQTLALLRDPDVLKVLAKKEWTCHRFWVGLRREEWVDNEGSQEDIIYDHWDPSQYPNSGVCGSVEMQSLSWTFRPSDCQKKMPYICDAIRVNLTTESNLTTNYHDGSGGWTTAVIIITVTCGVIVLGIIGICFTIRVGKKFCRKNSWVGCKRRGRQMKKIDTDVDPSVMIELTEKGFPDSITKDLQRRVAHAIFGEYSQIELWGWDDNFRRVKLDELYTDLVFAKNKSTTLGDKEKHLRFYTDMFKKESTLQQFVYLEGAAGTGKTTLAKRLLVDWAKYTLTSWWRRTFLTPRHIKRQLGKFKLVLPIFLRDVNHNQSLSEVVHQNINIGNHVSMESIIEGNQRHILFLFEGLDEYREETAPDITNIIRRNHLTQTNLIITSRNRPSLHFKSPRFPTTHVILKGFSDKGVKTYTDLFFHNSPDGENLRTEIAKSKDRKDLSCYPAVLLLMCVLWWDQKKIADSVTEFYFDFVKYVCGRYEQKFVPSESRSDQGKIINKYHPYIMEIGKIAVDGFKGNTLELSFAPSVLNGLSDVAKKLGLLNTSGRTDDKERKHTKKSLYFQHKTLQEFLTAYFVVNCQPKMRQELFYYFVNSPNALKESTMIVTFLKGLGNEIITRIIHDIIEGSEGDKAKTHTAVQLAFLSDLKAETCLLPKKIEIEFNNLYTPEVLRRYFSMDSSRVETFTIWAPSVGQLRYLTGLLSSKLKSVTIYKQNTGFVDSPGMELQREFDEPLKIDTLSLHNFDNISADDNVWLSAMPSENGQAILHGKHFRISFLTKANEAGGYIKVHQIVVECPSLNTTYFLTWCRTHFITSVICKSAQYDRQSDLLDILNTQNTNSTCEPSNLIVLDMRRIRVSAEVSEQIWAHVRRLSNLKELYLCKCDTENAIEFVITNLKWTLEIETLDISGNISNPEPYEVLDVRGRTTGNKVTSDVYQTLGDRMTSLTKLRELRLCECDEPRGLIPVVRSLHHVTQLQSLDLSGNMAEGKVFEILGEQLKHLGKLRVLRLCVSDEQNAVSHVIDQLYLVAKINILDISGLKAKFAKRYAFGELYNMSNSVDETVYLSLADQLQHLNDLRELRLCVCNDVDAVTSVIKGLRHTAILHTLDLLGNEVKYDVFTELGRQLLNFGELRELRLCYCEDHNAVGKIVKHLHHIPGLVVLDLTGTMVTGKRRGVKMVKRNTADRGVYETLSRQLQRLPRLRELRLCDCRYDHRGEGVAVVDGLQYTPGLQVLEMGRRSLDAAGVEQLGERPVNLREIRQLLLGNCDVYNTDDLQRYTSFIYVQIHKAWNKCVSQLSMLPQLQVLNLHNNNIGNDSVVQLSRQLTSLTHLYTLSMFRCGLTDTQAVIQLIDAFPSCPSLRMLDVRDNHLGDGLEQIVNMTQQLSRLYVLDLEYNKMSASVVENIKRQLKQKLPDLTLLV